MAQGQDSEGDGGLDLFGHPVMPLRDPRGRPSYAKSKENQLVVIGLAARGWSAEQIGPFIGCDAKTVRKHFSRELEHGALFLEGMAMQVLVKRMMDGHAPSVTKVLDMLESRVPAKSAPTKATRPIAVGKKEALSAAASQPPAGWGDLLN